MSKRDTLIILAVWVIVFLFLGFPSSLDKIFAVLTGLGIILASYRLPSPRKYPAPTQSSNDSPSGRKVDDIQSHRHMAYVEHKTVPGVAERPITNEPNSGN